MRYWATYRTRVIDEKSNSSPWRAVFSGDSLFFKKYNWKLKSTWALHGALLPMQCLCTVHCTRALLTFPLETPLNEPTIFRALLETPLSLTCALLTFPLETPSKFFNLKKIFFFKFFFNFFFHRPAAYITFNSTHFYVPTRNAVKIFLKLDIPGAKKKWAQ